MKNNNENKEVEDCNTLSCWVLFIFTFVAIVGGCVAIAHKFITTLFF